MYKSIYRSNIEQEIIYNNYLYNIENSDDEPTRSSSATNIAKLGLGAVAVGGGLYGGKKIYDEMKANRPHNVNLNFNKKDLEVAIRKGMRPTKAEWILGKLAVIPKTMWNHKLLTLGGASGIYVAKYGVGDFIDLLKSIAESGVNGVRWFLS
jgi:hypothetical protein